MGGMQCKLRTASNGCEVRSGAHVVEMRGKPSSMAFCLVSRRCIILNLKGESCMIFHCCHHIPSLNRKRV